MMFVDKRHPEGRAANETCAFFGQAWGELHLLQSK
jgi:hypothetical protein